MTPRHLVFAARSTVPLCLAALGWGVLALDCTPAAAAAGLVLTAWLLLLGAPKVRAGDLVGGLVLYMTLLECAHGGAAGALDGARWQAGVAAGGAMLILLKIQEIRALARQDAYVPLRHVDRRRVLLGQTSGRRATVDPTT